MDDPHVHSPGSWIDTVSRAHTHLEGRVSALEVSIPSRSSELRDQIAKLARRIGAIEEKLGLLDSPPAQEPKPAA